MDGDTGRWALEFFIGKRIINNTLIQEIIRTIKVPPNPNSYFIKSLLLRILQERLQIESIDESMLEIMEILEEVLRSEGSPVSASFTAAYCAVAVECTLKYIKLEGSIPRYFDSVKTIWWKRVMNMKPSPGGEKRSLLFSDELDRWRIDIEASLNDPCVRDRLAATENTRSVAINRLKVFFAELWEGVDPSFLELAVENAATDAAEEQQRETQEGNLLLDDICITNVVEEMDPSTTCQSDVPPTTTNAHAHEGETSNRPQLPSPKRKRVSPLKKYEPRNVIKRRTTRKWSQLEEETLEKAVNNVKLFVSSCSLVQIWHRKLEINVKCSQRCI
ncbi:uncharacterized protein LOC130729086 isoform X2 [Lotus japonicus]|uniref:uncharacterized protein LOC130729086 isoform X2 n=1 Tax=Lotus japonicus TaxID=34305 RepID=UPI002587A909|nr:uncharacterized protein LOC130729086 isoform X2 [Lotus japonicus]